MSEQIAPGIGKSRESEIGHLSVEQLQTQNKLMEQACRMAKVGSFYINTSTLEAICSKEVLTIMDSERSTLPLPEWTEQLFNRFDVAEFSQAIDRCSTFGIPFSLEFKIITPKGNEKWIRSIGSPVVENNRIIGVEGAIQDISQLHLVSAEKESLNSISTKVFEVSPDLFFLVDSEMRFVDYHVSRNSPLYAHPEHFIGKKVSEILPSNIAIPFGRGVQQAQQTQEMSVFEYDLDIPAYGCLHYECRIGSLDGGSSIAIIRDITEQHQRQTDLVKSEQKFRLLLEAAPFPVFISVDDGTIKYVNKRAKEQIKLLTNDGIGSSASDYYENVAERDKILSQLKRKGAISDYEIRLLDSEKKPYWALVSANYVEFENEQAIMVAINDISA